MSITDRSRDIGSEPYSDQEFGAAFVRTQRSDLAYVAIRAIMLAVVLFIMARSIAVHGVTAGFLLLPFAVEWLAVMWLGLFLTWFVVDCPAFAKTGKPVLVVFWTLMVGAIVSALLAWGGEGGGFSTARIAPGWRAGWSRVVETGLIWALVAEVLGLVFATAPEVARWRRVGGKFVWTTIFSLGLRGAAMILIGVVGFFLFVALAESFGAWVLDTPRRLAWLVYGFLLAVEVGALALGVAMHRDLGGNAFSGR